ncbi:MAG TPA: indole-3-glycerol phosphate synthase TrpC [Rhizobiales bacterium]|nr:indole-3-glycerol phosphate synthase [bacterium BMS3Bbin10]HDO52928.1 indole-3-glycerol phosphate synthase TrpC [Hyphomicrobiales bacterium]
MANVLDEINAYKREEIAAAKAAHPLRAVEEQARAASPVRGFIAAITKKIESGASALIAEIKKASPSKGLIREDFDPASLARAYESGGAACLSVLTDEPSFQGHPAYLGAAREACALPVLRKDFMLDPYQVAEARSWGADCILIILAGVGDAQAAELCAAAKDWSMDVLAEVHDENELERALGLDTPLIGINNRDLNSFETSLETTGRLAPMVPDDRIIVSESGIGSPEDLTQMEQYGVRAFLVGESLMRQGDVEAATRTLLAAPAREHGAAAQ